MKPTYRGIPYAPNTSEIRQRYPYQVQLGIHPPLEMTYRGVRYTR